MRKDEEHLADDRCNEFQLLISVKKVIDQFPTDSWTVASGSYLVVEQLQDERRDRRDDSEKEIDARQTDESRTGHVEEHTDRVHEWNRWKPKTELWMNQVRQEQQQQKLNLLNEWNSSYLSYMFCQGILYLRAVHYP